MKKTLLGMTQAILSDMGEDEINTLGDTTTSLQVVNIIQHTFDEIAHRKDWPHFRTVGQLVNLSDVNRPTTMSLPTDTSKVEFVAYNRKQSLDNIDFYRELIYMYPDEFLRYTQGRNPDNDNVVTVTDGVVYYVLNDKPPQYFTSFDDKKLIMDAYVADISTTLTAVNSQLIYYREPTWSSTDAYIPDLPSEAFPLLYAEAKSACFLELKQIVNQKAEQQANRHNGIMAQRSWAVKGGVRFENYGRNSKKTARGRHFNRNQYTG